MTMQLGVIGLGTMGANLARNAARNGAKVVVFNRTTGKTDEFMKQHGAEGNFVACTTLEEFVAALEPPRPILIMVEAGKPVDAVIESLTPLLRKGDILIDGGNSHHRDTERRIEELGRAGVRFIGMGVSGGAAGALNGPSMMPGGDESAWNELQPLLERMAAEVEDWGQGPHFAPLRGASRGKRGQGRGEGKCVTYVGPGGAGHFVKMVHNGIEYALMQLIAESYDLLKSEGGRSNEELAAIFEAWNGGEDLQSFLVEITGKIVAKKENGEYIVDLIKDTAVQKGTGKWTLEAAMEFGVAIPTINAAVDARIISGSVALRNKGKQLSETVEQPLAPSGVEGYPKPEKLTSRVRVALELSMICSYLQGFELMRVASEAKGWNLNLGEIARIFRSGCIIRSAFLTKLQKAYLSPNTHHLSPLFARFEGDRQLDWRRIVAIGTGRGIPLPAMSSALAWYDTVRRERLPQNLIQAQRDFFGAHGYERTDRAGTFHTDWGA